MCVLCHIQDAVVDVVAAVTTVVTSVDRRDILHANVHREMGVEDVEEDVVSHTCGCALI